MKRTALLLAILALCANMAISQKAMFEGVVIKSEKIGKGSETESVEYYKNGNSFTDISYLKTKIISKDGILYTIDYSTTRPTVNVMNIAGKSEEMEVETKKHSVVKLEKETINGHSCIIAQVNTESSTAFFTVKKTSQHWIDTSFCLSNSDSPTGKGLTMKYVSTMDMNGRKTTVYSEVVSVRECPVPDSLFHLPDTDEARYIYSSDVFKAINNPTDTALIKRIADVQQEHTLAPRHCKELSDEIFVESIKNGIAVVDFTAVWCKPCKLLKPIVEHIAAQNGKRANFYVVDTDKSKKTTENLSIKAVPVVIVFKNGVEVGRMDGFYPDAEKQIMQLVSKAESL